MSPVHRAMFQTVFGAFQNFFCGKPILVQRARGIVRESRSCAVSRNLTLFPGVDGDRVWSPDGATRLENF